jgi:hypothetical protein
MRGHPTVTAVAAEIAKRWLFAGNSSSAAPNDRLETDKAIAPITESLQIAQFRWAGRMHRTAGPQSQVDDKNPANRPESWS